MNERQPIFNVPRSVLVALGLIVGMHVVRVMLGSEEGFMLLLALAFIPARYATPAPDLPGGGIADVTSFVTYMFVHGDFLHLAVNGVWMLAFGSAVAQRVGDLRFAAFSLLCGVAGALVHLVVHFGELAPVVGASAAISGQMAAAIRFLFSAGSGGFGGDPQSRRLVPLMPIGATLRDPRILGFVAIWAAINVIFGTGVLEFQDGGGGIAWEAHLGGFACGLLVFGLFDRSRPRPLPRWPDTTGTPDGRQSLH